MKTLLTLLLSILPIYAAVPTGGLRINFDTTGTNTTSARVTVTAATNLNAGAIVATNLTASRALVSSAGSGITNSITTSAELAFVSGVTSGLQAQLDGKALQATTISAGAGMSGGGSLAANRTITWDASTFVNSLTFWDGSQASRTLTFNLTGTDPVLTFTSGAVNLSTGALQIGGVAVPTLTSSDTLANKTLTTPTIASFVNATHTHQNAAGGGTLDAAAIAAGTVATARLGSGSASSSTFLRGDQTWASAAGTSDNWTASGTTNSTLTGNGLLNALVATNGVTVGSGSSAGILTLGDTDSSNFYSETTDATMGTNIWVIHAKNPYSGGVPYYTVSAATNLTEQFTNSIVGLAGAMGVTGTPSSSTFLRGDGTWNTPAGGGDVTGQASSVDSEITLFSGTGGKTIKRATGSGIVQVTSGVYGTPFTTSGSGTVVALTAGPTFTTPTLGVASATTVNKWTLTAPTTSATLTAGGDNLTYTGPSSSQTIVGVTSTDTFQNKTLDSQATGNVLKFLDYKDFVYPARVDGAGCTIVTNSYTDNTWGLATYNGTGATTNVNYAIFRVGTVPLDIDTGTAMVLKNLAFRVSGTDTDAANFSIAYYSAASSAPGMPSDYTACTGFVTFNSGTLTSPAAGDVFYMADVTLTGWASGLTAGRQLIVAIAREDSANDDSISISGGTILYGRTQ